jgi:putative acetyltransferase
VTSFDIRIDDLESHEVRALLREHLDSIAPTAPAESRHALDLGGLVGPDITFWSAWDGPMLAGFGALKHLTESHAEVKSMRTATSHLRQGVATRILQHLVQEAIARGYSRLSLETGSMAFFAAARRLYEACGFRPCAPFGNYKPDPNSVFMTKQLDELAPESSSGWTREKAARRLTPALGTVVVQEDL